MMIELCRQEARKLLSQRYPYMILAVLVGLQLLRTLTLALQPPDSTLDVVSAPQAWADGAGWGLRVLTFCILVIGAMGFSREFSLGTAKTMLALPVKRSAWYAAKLLSLVALAWCLLAVMSLLGALAVSFTLGWGEVAREGVVLHGTSEYLSHMLRAFLMTALFLLPLCAAALLIGLYFGHSGPAVAVAVLSGMVLESVGGLFAVGEYSFLQHLYRPLGVVVRLGQGLPFRWDSSLHPGLTVAGISFVILAGWGLWRLERMDITD